MIDQDKLRDLKQRRATFAAFGQNEKVKAMDAEIAKLRKQADKIEVEEHKVQAEERQDELKVLEPDTVEPEPVEPETETAEADLSKVETATAGKKDDVRHRSRSQSG